MKKILVYFQRLSIFKKILISFITVIVIPALISLVISGKITENLIVNQAKKDASNNVDIVSISVSNVLNELKNASLYISNDESVMEYLTLLNEREELDGDDMIALMDLLRKVEATCNSVYYTKGIDMDFTLLSTSGKVAYSNYNVGSLQTQDYLEKYDSKYIKNIGASFICIGVEEGIQYSSDKVAPYVITGLKTIESRKDTRVEGVLIVSIPIQEIVDLMHAEGAMSDKVLLDEDKKIIVSARQEWLNKPFDELFTCDLGNNGHVTTVGVRNNDEYLLSYKRINRDDWYVVDMKPVSTLSEGFQSVSRNLILLNLLYIIIFIFVSIGLARNITVPLMNLSKSMQETDLEVPDRQIDTTTENEVEILQQNFDLMRMNIQRLIKENIEKEQKKREAEKKALYSQISPHFLFNTLNSVRCAIDIDKKEKASGVIVALMNLLRMTFRGDAMITLEQEVENLKYYVQILQLRHDISFKADFQIPDILVDYKVPKLLLQPIVENSITHGFEDLEREGYILVTAELEPSNLVIRIYDNGKGLDSNPLDRKSTVDDNEYSSIGIINVEQRIKAHYGEDYGISYESILGESTTAILTLPIFSDGEDIND